ncbi:MAG: hypothetical protein IJU45_05280 [Clostridia bacterium]|nr:hypothetical protein [Clostridia bacterium]
MKICIIENSPETKYAAQELERFLKEFTCAEITDGEADYSVELKTDKDLAAHCYSIHTAGKMLEIVGGSASAVLCGVCDALSEAGILFEASRYSAPLGFDLDAFFSVNKDAEPKFRLRGIRQHINFPMDISSYPLNEAKEYIRSLARMRFNAITFHTYPNQWHFVHPDDPDDKAGMFFYGQVHTVPADDPLTASKINNRKIYCIPEVEAIFDDDAKRAEYAFYWLNEVMKTAKEAGMKITLSVEIRSDDFDREARMLHVLCETYPLIDTLEIITEENAGERNMPEITDEKIKDFMLELFGDRILDADGNIPYLKQCRPSKCAADAVCLKRTVKMMETREEWLAGLQKRPEIRAGIYITECEILKVLVPVLRKFLPEGMTMSLLPAHGALAAADNIEQLMIKPEDWQNTILYSWAEFDGNMYIQQMSTDGIEKLCALPPTDSSYGVCINHWRTAENRLTITYAAEAMSKSMSASDFYLHYAKRLGISDREAFAELCTRLAKLDTYNRDHLFNIGFCYVGCWLSGHRRGDYMTPRGYQQKDYIYSINEYETLADKARLLLPFAGTKEGIEFLRLIENRCSSSILFIRSMQTLEELNDLFDFDDPAPISAQQAQKIDAVLNRSRAEAMAALHLYGEMLPDRGCEGQMVSYYETVPVYIDEIIRSLKGSKFVSRQGDRDEPPMPDTDAR